MAAPERQYFADSSLSRLHWVRVLMNANTSWGRMGRSQTQPEGPEFGLVVAGVERVKVPSR